MSKCILRWRNVKLYGSLVIQERYQPVFDGQPLVTKMCDPDELIDWSVIYGDRFVIYGSGTLEVLPLPLVPDGESRIDVMQK